MRKVILVSLILALLVAIVLPAVVAPAPALASSSITCTPTELSLTVYAGIPVTDSQTLTVNSNGGWTAKDDADWLSFSPGLAFSGKDMKVWVSKDLAAGTYTATITITPFFSSNSITVPVTVNVIEPKVLGPLGIGADKDLLKGIFGGETLTATTEYGGFTVNLLTDPVNTMDMQAIETDGGWNLLFKCGEQSQDGSTPITGGEFSIQGETKQISGGGVFPIASMMSMFGGVLPIPADFDWGENYVASFSTSDGTLYIGILLADIGKMLDLLPMLLGGSSSGGTTPGTDLSAPPSVDPNTGSPDGPVSNEPSTELVIPLKPILNLLPTLMPVMMDLLSNETILNILKPLMGLLPPIMIVMPMDLMMQLGSLLM